MNVIQSSFLIIGEGVTYNHCANFFKKNNISFTSLTTNNILNIDNNLVECVNKEIDLNKIDYAIVSPGILPSDKLLKSIENSRCRLTTDIEIVQSMTNTKFICVTGTNGKTSTVSLISDILNDNSISSIACGNNGISVFKSLETTYDYIILEVSSYQLEHIKYLNSYISVILNLTSDHLERHGTLDKYLEIKLKIFKNAKYKIINKSLDYEDKYFNFEVKDRDFIVNKSKINQLSVTHNNIIFQQTHYPIVGYHEVLNLCACLAIMNILNLPLENIMSAFSKRNLMQHRVEEFISINGTKFINDSKSTNAESTLNALKSVNENIILIMGGDKKEMSYKMLIEIINNKVKLLVIIGENKDYLFEELTVDVKKICFDTLESAADYIFTIMSPGDTVLMSPGTSSYYMYDNYEHRGGHFKNIVMNYASQ